MGFPTARTEPAPRPVESEKLDIVESTVRQSHELLMGLAGHTPQLSASLMCHIDWKDQLCMPGSVSQFPGS